MENVIQDALSFVPQIILPFAVVTEEPIPTDVNLARLDVTAIALINN
jgi:hypothetical protein